MASRLSELIVKISGNPDGFRGAMAQVNRDLKVGLDRVENTSRGFMKFGQLVGSVGQSLTLGFSLPVIGFGAAAVKSAGDIEALKLGLTAVTGSASIAEKQFAELREVSKLPGLGLQEAVRGATNLQAVGFSAAKSKEILLQFGNALASVGRGREDLEEVIRQLGQMASRGKVTADNLKPIIERVPQAAAVIRKEFGTIDTEVLQKMGISAQRLTDLLLREFGKFERVSSGIKNDFENMKESMELAFVEAGNALKPYAKALIDFGVATANQAGKTAREFGEMSTSAQNWAISLGTVATASPLALVGLNSVATAVLSLKAIMGTAGPLGLATFFGVTGAAAIILKGHLDELRDRMKAGLDTARELATDSNTHWSKFDRTVAGVREGVFQFGRALKGTADLGKEVPPVMSAISAEVKKAEAEYRKFVRAQAAAQLGSKVMAEMMAILNREHQNLVTQLAEVRLKLRVWTDRDVVAAMRELPPVIGESVDQMKDLMGFGALAAKEFDKLTQARDFKINLNAAVLEDMRREVQAFGGAAEASFGKVGTAARREIPQVSLIVNDLAQNLTDLTFEGGKLKDRLSDAFTSIGKALLRSALETQLTRIANLVKDVAKGVPGLGKVLGGIFGPAASAGGTAAGGAASTGGSVASSGASAVTSAASGAMNIANLITGAITAGASVFTAVMSVRQEGTLNQIERNTAAGSIHLVGILEKLNTFIPYLKLQHEATLGLVVPVLREVRDAAKGFVTVKVNVGEGGSEDQARLIGSIVERAQTFDTTSGDRLLDIHAGLIEMRGAIVDWLQVVNASIIGMGSKITEGLKRIGEGQAGLLERTINSIRTGGFGGVTGGIGGVGGLAGGIPGAVGSLAGGAIGGLLTRADLGKIEVNTRQIAEQLIGGIQPVLNTWLPFLKPIHDRLATVVDQGVGVYNAAGDAWLRVVNAGEVAHQAIESIKVGAIATVPALSGAAEQGGSVMEQLLPHLRAIQDRMAAVVDRGIGVYSARGASELRIAGGGGLTIHGGVHFHGMEGDNQAVFDQFITRLKRHGIIPRNA